MLLKIIILTSTLLTASMAASASESTSAELLSSVLSASIEKKMATVSSTTFSWESRAKLVCLDIGKMWGFVASYVGDIDELLRKTTEKSVWLKEAARKKEIQDTIIELDALADGLSQVTADLTTFCEADEEFIRNRFDGTKAKFTP